MATKMKLGRYKVLFLSCNSILNYDFKNIHEKKFMLENK